MDTRKLVHADFFLLQAILRWWAETGYPEALKGRNWDSTSEALEKGMQQLVAAALAPAQPAIDSALQLGEFKVYDAVASYSMSATEKQGLRKDLEAQSYAVPCEDKRAAQQVMEIVRALGRGKLARHTHIRFTYRTARIPCVRA